MHRSVSPQQQRSRSHRRHLLRYHFTAAGYFGADMDLLINTSRLLLNLASTASASV